MINVIKIGGSILANGLPDNLLDGLAKLDASDTIIVHGGGPTVTSLSERMGIESKFTVSPSGIRSRYTDSNTMEAFIMAMKGKLSAEIALKLLSKGVPAAGFAGIDGGTIVAERKKKLLTINEKGRKFAIEGGYTGSIVEVNETLLRALLSSGIMPVISPIALGTEFEALNVDGDRAAARIAGKIGAENLILLTDVDGLMRDGAVVPRMTHAEAREEMKKTGNGMDKKVLASTEALELGVKRVIIANGLVADPIVNALKGIGTVITND